MPRFNQHGSHYSSGRISAFDRDPYAEYPAPILSPIPSRLSPDLFAYLLSDNLAPSPASTSSTSCAFDGPETIPKSPSPPPKRTRKARRGPSHIRRPRNAFIVFRSAFICAQKQAGKGQQNELSKQAGLVWNAMSDEEKHEYQEIARMEQLIHKLEHPNYQYTPGPSRRGQSKPKREKKPVAIPIPSQPPASSQELVECPEFTFPRLVMTDGKEDQPDFSVDTLPPSLRFGEDAFMFDYRATDGSYTIPAVPEQLDYSSLEGSYNFSESTYSTAPVDSFLPSFDYGLDSFDFSYDTFLADPLLTFD